MMNRSTDTFTYIPTLKKGIKSLPTYPNFENHITRSKHIFFLGLKV